MRIATSAVQLQPYVREQAAQTLSSGGSVTLTGESSGQPTASASPRSPVGEVHVITADQFYKQQLGLKPGESAFVRSLREDGETWEFLAGIAKDAIKEHSVDALRGCHPACAQALDIAFTIFDRIEDVAMVKVDDTTVGAIVVDGMKRRFVIRPQVKSETVEIGIQPHLT